MKHAQLLAQLHVSKGSYTEAATVLYALAMRKSGPGDSAASLQQRLEHLRAAALQVGELLVLGHRTSPQFCSRGAGF